MFYYIRKNFKKNVFSKNESYTRVKTRKEKKKPIPYSLKEKLTVAVLPTLGSN